MSERAGEVECTGEEERESVCDLNAVGLKTVEIGSTGQTGYPEFPFRFKEIRCVVCTHKGYSILSEFQKNCLCMRILTNHCH